MNRKEALEKSLEYFNGDELAANVVVDKYLLRDNEDNYLEGDLSDVFKRIANEIERVEKKEKETLLSREEVLYVLDNRYAIFQGSPLFGIGNPYSRVTLSNCYVVPQPYDSISGIMDAGKELAILFKSRGGAGINLDTLRPEGAAVSNSARFSSGAWSFASLFSDITKAIGQQGRRGALMVSMSSEHPDLEKFIACKNDKTAVTSANISVCFSDAFLRAVENNETYNLRWPLDGKAVFEKSISASNVWETFIKSNISSAEPGALFWDRMKEYTPNASYEDFKPICVNPCAEVAMGAYSNCRLGSINLLSFVKNRFREDAYFDYELFKRVIYIFTIMMDDLVTLDLEKMEILASSDDKFESEMWKKYIDKTTRGREIGIGTHGLADCLAALRKVYGEEDAIEFCDKTYRLLRDEVYKTSQFLAKKRGAFPAYSEEKEVDNLFIKQDPVLAGPRRNISLLTSAPTGSISIIHQVSSGIEPIFKQNYVRRTKATRGEEGSVRDVDGQSYVEHVVYHPLVGEIIKSFGVDSQAYLDKYCIEAHKVSPLKKVDMQETIQKYIDHSISNTYNLPKGVSMKEVSDLYLYAWKKGLKGITIYVDGSRMGVLVDSPKTGPQKRPDVLPCDIHYTTVRGKKWIVFVGLYDGKPYEVFCGEEENVELNKKIKNGFIQKVYNKKENKNIYNLLFTSPQQKDGVLYDIVSMFSNPEQMALGRMISLSLRNKVNISVVVEQLAKDSTSDFMSYNKVLSRILKKYIEEGTVSEEKCPLCENSLVFEDGCKICKNCGWGGCS